MCLRCSRTGRKCEYGTATRATYMAGTAYLQLQRQPLTSIARLDFWNPASMRTRTDERWAFEFYFDQVTPNASGVPDLDFWRGVVIQICHYEPAIWDAVIALSSLYFTTYESKEDSFPLFTFTDDSAYGGTVTRAQAFEWYARSLSSIRSQINQSTINPQVALVSCMLFICFEALCGNITQAYKLYCQGSALMYSLCSPTVNHFAQMSSDSAFFSNVLPIFIRLGMSTFLFGREQRDLRIPHRFRDKSHLFENFGDCRLALYGLMEECFSFANNRPQELGKSCSSSDVRLFSVDAFSKQSELLKRLGDWESAAMNSRIILQSEGKELLLMLHGTTYIITATCLSDEESIYDKYIDRFETILQYASDLSSKSAKSSNRFSVRSFETTGGLSLYHTMIKCRDPRLRRRALELSGKETRVHASYGVLPGAMLGAKVIELEEDPSVCSDENDHSRVPPGYPNESHRVKEMHLKHERQRNGTVNIYFQFTKNKWDSSLARWYPVETLLPVSQGLPAAKSQKLLFNLGKEYIAKVLGSSVEDMFY